MNSDFSCDSFHTVILSYNSSSSYDDSPSYVPFHMFSFIWCFSFICSFSYGASLSYDSLVLCFFKIGFSHAFSHAISYFHIFHNCLLYCSPDFCFSEYFISYFSHLLLTLSEKQIIHICSVRFGRSWHLM